MQIPNAISKRIEDIEDYLDVCFYDDKGFYPINVEEKIKEYNWLEHNQIRKNF